MRSCLVLRRAAMMRGGSGGYAGKRRREDDRDGGDDRGGSEGAEEEADEDAIGFGEVGEERGCPCREGFAAARGLSLFLRGAVRIDHAGLPGNRGEAGLIGDGRGCLALWRRGFAGREEFDHSPRHGERIIMALAAELHGEAQAFEASCLVVDHASPADMKPAGGPGGEQEHEHKEAERREYAHDGMRKHLEVHCQPIPRTKPMIVQTRHAKANPIACCSWGIAGSIRAIRGLPR